MSRIRKVKGHITEMVGGDYKIYSASDIVESATDKFHETANGGLFFGEPEDPPTPPDNPAKKKIDGKVLVHFRPHKRWKGEFGFDWLRLGDTKLFNDRNWSKVVAYQYEDSKFKTKVTDPNKYKGYFKKDETMYGKLKKEYKSFVVSWKTHKDKKTGQEVAEEYFVPWLSIKKDEKVEVTFFAEIEEGADYIEFDSSDYFSFTPSKIDIKGQKKVKLNASTIEIKCIREFSENKTIEIKACRKNGESEQRTLAGMISVWANDSSRQKESKVVFVKIMTKISLFSTIQVPKVDGEKERINQYLSQAYIKLSDDSDIAELDFTAEKDFVDFVTDSKVDGNKESKGRSLVNYLKQKLEDQYEGKYAKHFKAFYFAEDGYSSKGNSLLAGFSSFGADYVVLFKGRTEQTAVHEFLHSLNLPHTFTNKESIGRALFTYWYKKTDNLMDYSHHPNNNNKRCSLFFWQWKPANASIK